MTDKDTKAQIERDLAKRFRERITQAAMDCNDLCEVAELDSRCAPTIISGECILLAIGIIEQMSDVSPEKFGKMCATGLKLARKESKEKGEENVGL